MPQVLNLSYESGWWSSYLGAEGTVHHGIQFLSKNLRSPCFCGVENGATHPFCQDWFNECLREEHYSKREKRKQRILVILAAHQMFTANLSNIHYIVADRSLLREQHCVVLVEEVWIWYCGTWSILWSWLCASSLFSSCSSTCVSTRDQALNGNTYDIKARTSQNFSQLHTTRLKNITEKQLFCRMHNRYLGWYLIVEKGGQDVVQHFLVKHGS